MFDVGNIMLTKPIQTTLLGFFRSHLVAASGFFCVAFAVTPLSVARA